MSLKDYKFKAVYKSEGDDLLNDFYIPALSRSVIYKRAAGFFSAAMLSAAAQGISAFYKNNGKMQLIFGGEITAEESAAIKEGYDRRKILRRIEIEIFSKIQGIENPLFNDRLNTLSWLIAGGTLDIKVALRRKGMYHEKIGIMEDGNGDFIVFQGSMNETNFALIPELNYESINVFPSWRIELEDHFKPHLDAFGKLWNNSTKDTLVLDFPEALKKKLIEIAPNRGLVAPNVEREKALKREFETRPYQDDNLEESTTQYPSFPENLGGFPFKPLEHQNEALLEWRNNDFKGILALATGAGKTITALIGATTITLAAIEKESQVFLIIAVPYVSLADQWVEVCKKFNIYPIRCYHSRDKWVEKLSLAINLFNKGVRKFVAVVVVNATLAGKEFQNQINNIDSKLVFFIGDECHHYLGENSIDKLPPNPRFCMGLSATPEHYYDQESNKRLKGYLGDVVSRYSLKHALDDKILTPYEYYVFPTPLEEDEEEYYITLTRQIAPYVEKLSKGLRLNKAEREDYNKLIRVRSILLGCARQKLIILESLLSDLTPSPMTLFYSGDGGSWDEDSGELERQVEKISQRLGEMGWISSRFTAQEPPRQRQLILEHFSIKAIQALVAMRCLDEGIDIPGCDKAYILASSRNPREWVQRRGRILRKAPGKEKSTIYDFVLYIPRKSRIAKHEQKARLLESELERVKEFASLSLNPEGSFQSLKKIMEQFGLKP